jgi:hypothetical protein
VHFLRSGFLRGGRQYLQRQYAQRSDASKGCLRLHGRFSRSFIAVDGVVTIGVRAAGIVGRMGEVAIDDGLGQPLSLGV